jgi:spore germination protein GerM
VSPARAGTALLVAAVVLAVALGACGVGTTSHVEQISPVELARAVPSTTVTGSTSEPVAVTVSMPDTSAAAEVTPLQVTTTTVPVTTTTAPPEPFTAYFVEGSELIPLTVDVPAGSRLRRQLRTLEDGLTPAELATGVRTAVPAGVIDRVQIGLSQVTVDLDDSQFDAMEPSEQLLLVAQIVLTLTGDPGYTAVAFESNGQPRRVPRPNNIVLEPGEPVMRADYESMLANPESSGQ